MCPKATILRRVCAADLESILAIERQASPKSCYPREVIQWYIDNLAGTFVVVVSGMEVVGYAIYDDDGHVCSMAIKPAFRRQGLGRRLIWYAAQHVGKRLWLEVRTRNRGAIAFYRRLGLREVGTVPAYYGDDDALIMVLERSGD
jgi:ribosomal-protein-alanine N-acetyltransferase